MGKAAEQAHAFCHTMLTSSFLLYDHKNYVFNKINSDTLNKKYC